MPKIRSTKKHPKSAIHYRAPFSVSKDGLYVLDRLGYVVAQFQETEFIGSTPAAEAIASAFNQSKE